VPPERDLLVELASRVARGEPVVVATAVAVRGTPPCRPGQKLLLGPGGPLAGTLGCAELDTAAAAHAAGLLALGEPALRTLPHDLGEVDAHLEPYPAPDRLVVLGATPVAIHLLRFARELGYRTVLVEPRPERVRPELAELADEVREAPPPVRPGEVVDAVHTDHDAPDVVGHLAELLSAPTRFVGLVASRRHGPALADALRRSGLGDAEVGRLRSPVGLDLGGRTPAEVALSIAAGLVAARCGRRGGFLDEA
jgi:xanthine dehydrogenase accessory factor